MSREPDKPSRSLFRLGALNVRQTVRDEFDFHLRMTVRELVDSGMSRGEAEAEARRRFGRIDRYRDSCQQIGNRNRRQRLGEAMNDVLQDLRIAVRRLGRSPLFTTVALLTLALGIGANTAVFSLVNGVVLQPLPYRDPGDLAALWMEKTDGSATDSFSYPDFLDVSAQTEALADVGFWTWWGMDITDADEPITVQSVRVSANMLSILGVEPAEGRLFRAGEDQAGNENVAIVSHTLWQGHYGGDPDLVGGEIEIDGNVHTVVGIMPQGFRFPYVQEYGAGFWTPLPMDLDEDGRTSRWINPVGRLEEGASIEQARSELATIAGRLAQEFPASNAAWTMTATPMHESVVGGNTKSALWILYGVAGFVLLIACANLANLQLARMESRNHEIAVRAALGAGRPRLLRELLAESCLLSIGGGVLGIAVAAWGMNLFVSLVPSGVPRLDEIGFDGMVLAFGIVATVGSGVLFGLFPAAHASRRDLQDTLKSGTTRTGGSMRHKFRASLVVAEVAIALVLLIGAGLLVRSFNLLLSEDIGFDADRVLTFQLSPWDNDDAAIRYGFYRDIIDRLSGMPDVEVVGANTSPPLSGVQWSMEFAIGGRPFPAPGQMPSAEFNIVNADYFRSLGIPLVQGRFFTDDDGAGENSNRVVIINEAFAQQHFPDDVPMGRSMYVGGSPGDDGEAGVPPSFEVVGVVGNTRKFGVDREAPAELYIPYAQSPPYFMNFVVRTRTEPVAMVDAIRTQIWEVDDAVGIDGLSTMDQRLASSIAEPRFNMMLVGSFALLALVLSTLGIYGVVAYSAAERTREIGVRIALGAEKADVFRLMLGQGLWLTTIGVGLGLAASFAAHRVMSSLVYGVTTTDPLTFVSVALILTAVALLAAYLPARRATRVDPLVALRDD